MKRLILASCCLLFISIACNDNKAIQSGPDDSEPKNATDYYNRGVDWHEEGELDKAIADYSEAIRLDPKKALFYNNRGFAWHAKSQLDKAIADYKEAIRLNPEDAMVYNNLAWLQATCPDARYRNGRDAVKNARKSCELSDWKIHIPIVTLAAAHAENGEFDEAVKWEETAVKIAPTEDKSISYTRLELYKAHQPYRDSPTQ